MELIRLTRYYINLRRTSNEHPYIIYIALTFSILIASCDEPIKEKDPEILAGTTLTFAKDTVTKPRRDGSYTQEATKTEVPDDKGAITYTSSDDAIATVETNTGAVTFVSENGGEVTIIAKKAEIPKKYQASTAKYKLTITISDGTTLTFDEPTVTKPYTANT